MAGIKTTDPGVHGTIIKSTVSKRDGIFDEITCLNLWPGSNPWVLESMGPLFLIHSEQKRRHIWWNNVFEFTAEIITLGSGVQRHIKSTVSIKDGIFYEITCLNLQAGSNPCVLESNFSNDEMNSYFSKPNRARAVGYEDDRFHPRSWTRSVSGPFWEGWESSSSQPLQLCDQHAQRWRPRSR